VPAADTLVVELTPAKGSLPTFLAGIEVVQEGRGP